MSEQPNDRQPDDEQLRRVFARMRQEDGERVPPFPVLSSVRSVRWRRRLLPAFATAAIVATATLWFLLPPDSASDDDAMLLAEWSAPTTAFLGLDGFGVELSPGDETALSGDLDEWTDFPTDLLMQQAGELLGEEMQ